jgi:hypothetical protein
MFRDAIFMLARFLIPFFLGVVLLFGSWVEVLLRGFCVVLSMGWGSFVGAFGACIGGVPMLGLWLHGVWCLRW